MIKKAIIPWTIFLLSLVAVYQYIQHREEIFPVLQAQYQLDHRFTSVEIQDLISPFFVNTNEELKFDVDTFVDRNSVKFLQKTLSQDQFESVLQKENLPLWGWIITIKEPFQAKVKISYQKKLIGFESELQKNLTNLSNNRLDLLLALQKKSSKVFVENPEAAASTILLNPELHFQKQIAQTELVETISLYFEKNMLVKFESNLLLPVSYANLANADIEKQKSMHHFFNLFNYILVSLIFLFLFRTYENHLLPWKKNLPLFFVLFAAHFFNHLFTSNFHQTYFLSIFQSIMKSLGSTFWMYALIVAADLVARTFRKSSYSLSDITNLSFFKSSLFRNSLVAGWVLFVVQLVFVGIFYKIFLRYSAYVPLKIPGEHSIFCTFEFLKYFFDSLSTAIYEEVLYRMFFICLFASVFKKTWPAILISSVLWGFLHFSYQFEPYYIRGLELTLIGLFYGWIMIRYGIISVIFAHFLYNSFVLSEYEHQFELYLFGVFVVSLIVFFSSYLSRKTKTPFVFSTLEFPKSTQNQQPLSTERRNTIRKIYPLSWKYGLGILVVVIFFLVRTPMPQHDSNPLANRDKLIQLSTKIISPYNQEELWNITYNKSNADANTLREKALIAEDKKTLVETVNYYSYLWSVRFFTKGKSKIVCDFDYARDYELVRLQCPYTKSSQKLTFDEWVHRIKKPDETWTLFNVKPFDNGITQYEYTIEKDLHSSIAKSALITFQNGQLVHFKKQINIIQNTPDIKKPFKLNLDTSSLALSIVFIAILFGFFKYLFEVLRNHSFYERKALAGAIITSLLFALWKINTYKEVLIDFTNALSWHHVIFNEVVFFIVKWITLGGISYLIFYAFIYFPSKTFKFVPSSSDWNGILKRPVWKWRNTKTSLLYAFLLLCIQTLLRLLIHIDNGMPELDLFHFDVSYLNHEFIFITFLGLFWKNLIFWITLMIVISILEKYLPRWIYLTILCGVVFMNVWFSDVDINSKLIELCGIYIVFYFVYNIARFDFAFYFWFILLNTILTFLPLLIYSQYSSYLYQVVFIFIFVLMMIVYTIFQKKRVLKL